MKQIFSSILFFVPILHIDLLVYYNIKYNTTNCSTLTLTGDLSSTQKNAQVVKLLPWGFQFNLYSPNFFIINCIASSFLIENLIFKKNFHLQFSLNFYFTLIHEHITSLI